MLRKLFFLLFWVTVIFFVVLYPMLISIYVTLPLFIGFSGYMFLRGLDGEGIRFIILPLLYMLNLEINLSLPLLMVLLAVLIYYLSIYPLMQYIKRCPVCIAAISVFLINLIYFILLLLYDFIFDTTSIGIDSLLYYSLVIDLIAAVIL